MSATLPGVRVGPLDPESTAQFGQVAAQNSARQLIRLHAQMYPPALRRALARPLLEGHSKAVLEHLDAVGEYVAGQQRENGDPVIPEDAEVVGAAVRGDLATGAVLTFTFRLPSGRVGKWFAPYTPEALPEVHEIGQEYTRVHQMRDRGLVAFDSEATGQEIYRRQLAQAQNEVRRLRSELEGREPQERDGESVDTRSAQAIVDENEQLRREVEESRARLAQYESLGAAAGGGVPTAGLEADIAASSGGPGPSGRREPAASQDPPFEGYDDLKADQVVSRLRSDETSEDERRAILEYERAHANRKSVVAAGEESLGSSA